MNQPLSTEPMLRWLQFPTGTVLHRVALLREYDEDEARGRGAAVCGRGGTLMLPGPFSRLGAPRCRKCCDALGVPPGGGQPRNYPDETWSEA